MAQFNTLTISDITRQTDQCVTLTFDVPSLLKSVFSFKAGQYITLKATINGDDVRRDYSLCSSPSSGKITVAVKAIENGTFSTYANNTLKVGDTLEVSKPQGRFVFESNAEAKRTIAAFAAGSGITPVLSIAKTVLTEEPNSNMVLIYGNKTKNDTIFFNQLTDLQKQYSDRFHIQFLYSQSNDDDALEGRIQKSTVNLIVADKYKEITIDAFYLCGPEAMINTVKEALVENNVAEDKINFELFTASTKEEANTVEISDGNTEITVTVDDESETFTMSQKDTVLDAALKQDLDAPYSCQGGVCSSCLARVTDGKAVMRQNNILSDAEVAEGLILTCQAHPTTATLVVDFDDV